MNNISRRTFLKSIGFASAAAIAACKGKKEEPSAAETIAQEPPIGKLTYRIDPKTGQKVSLLGYGMMRLPMRPVEGGGDDEEEIDQEQVNRLVDYAIEHGVNYFDTSPAYCRGRSEEATGRALARHKRSEFLIATKLSNFSEETWSFEASRQMYRDSMRYLQVDYIDYLLLHGIGMGGMENLKSRYLDNGVLDFLLKEREAGRIRHLGFSYHGDIACFDYLLAENDRYHWDFVQIELNYLDWNYADEINPRNTDAVYLYGELEKRGIPAVIMEPLLGGRLANVPKFVADEMKRRAPQSSIASWAFRFAGSPKGILTVLSGMTYMEHLRDNLLTYSPLKPVTAEEREFLEQIAEKIYSLRTIPCNDCKYCMPCPYGVDIPGVFTFYNKCKNEGTVPTDSQDPDYARLRRRYLIDYARRVQRERQADRCIGCRQCIEHCPQGIQIPDEMQQIDRFIDELLRDGHAKEMLP